MQEDHSKSGNLVQLLIAILCNLIASTVLPNHGELIWSSSHSYYSYVMT